MVQQVSFVIRTSSPDEGRTIQGQIEHVLTGATAHFRDLRQLQIFIAEYLQSEPEPGQPVRPATGTPVSSMFSFLRRRPDPPEEDQPTPPEAEPAALPPAPVEPAAPGEPPTVVLLPADAPLPPGDTPVVLLPPGVVPPEAAVPTAPVAFAAESSPPPIDIDPHLGGMLDLLRDFLPGNATGLPPNTVSVVSLDYRALGLGGRYGMQTSNGLDIAELRGGWLDAIVRFDIWAADPAAAGTATAVLQSNLAGAGLDLRRQGVLRLKLSAAADADRGGITGWRRTLDYSVLYEYRYQDTDGAASLIARVPIDSQTDTGPATHETTEVRDWMIRWDDEATPALLISAPPRATLRISGLSIAAYLPAGGPVGAITQQITSAGVTQTTTFATLGAFLAGFPIEGGSLDLIFPPLPLQTGETLEIRAFEVRELRFEPPITLKGGDTFQISFDAAAFLAGNQSQVYLRALGVL